MDDPFSPSDLLDFEPSTSPGIYEKDREGQPVFAMSVEIKDGQVGVLKVRVDDDPRILATEFAQTHDLDGEQTELLVQYIIQNQLLATRNSVSRTKPSEKTDGKEIRTGRQMHTVSARTSVHERLYQYRKRAIPSPKAAISTPPRHRSYLNYGNWLYIRGMQSKERIKLKSEQRKHSFESVQAKELTFTPVINKISSLMSPRIERKTEEMLFRKAKEIREKLEEKRAKSVETAMRECSFVPKVNKRKERTSSVQPRFSRLYSEASSRSQRRLQASRSLPYSFKPHILPSKHPSRFDPQSFLARISQSKRVFTQKIEALQEKIHSKPVKKRDGLNIHDYLYSLRNKKQERLSQASLDLENSRKRARNNSKMTSRSEHYLKTLKNKAYLRYFRLLDSDNDGLISSEKCDLSSLEAKKVELLRPVLEGLGEGEMDLTRFVEETDSMVSTLSFSDKTYFLHGEGKQEHSSERRTMSVRTSLTSRMSSRGRSLLPNEDIYSRSISAKLVISPSAA